MILSSYQLIFIIDNSTTYLSGMFSSRSSLILFCLIFSIKPFWPWWVSFVCWFSTSTIFFCCALDSSFDKICFFSSRACFFKSYFFSFSSWSSNYSFSFLWRITSSNYAFSALTCSSSIFYFSFFCSARASWSSWLFLARISAYIFSFSRATLSLDSTALLARKASS